MNTYKIITLSLTTVCFAASAFAGSRSSASYNVPSDSADAGGRRATSAAYSHDGCIGGIAGVGTAAAPAEVAKHGYLGQIYNAASLAVTANPTNVNEGATRQLAARALLDDGTALVLAPAAVTWSPAGGPILSISAGGLLTAAEVYEDTLATAQGTWRGLAATLGLRVMNGENDNFGTYAGDGIDDAWQVQYFGVGNPNAAPGADGDGDGQPTGYEYYAGSNPTDGNSYFRFRIESVPGQPTRKNLVFSPRVPNRIYAVHYKLDFNASDWEKLEGFTVLDAGPQRTVTDMNATETNKFYRVEISIP
ncbi:MAG: hypothetical protein IPK15_02490 [Verrucomicrobia bacterium]|nr:hypothetical protein [Verrucomicrobiota bacterium]